MVHLERLGKRRHHLLLAHRHACERHLAALHLRHAHEDVRLGPVGDARLHLHDPARRPAPRTGALRHRLFAPQVVLVCGGLDCVLLHRRCAKCLRLCLADDHPRQQVVRAEGLLHGNLSHRDMLLHLPLPRELDRPRDVQRLGLRARDAAHLHGEPQGLPRRGHFLGRRAALGAGLPLPVDHAALLQQRHFNLQGQWLFASRWFAHASHEHAPGPDLGAQAHPQVRRELTAETVGQWGALRTRSAR
mmetsp:Transcript_159747/g.512569  ORF Transcript_159747/g.512569 Transcript_159747/m.512569 type:complete len:246 (+) Transcript_159747:8181-8918(+)